MAVSVNTSPLLPKTRSFPEEAALAAVRGLARKLTVEGDLAGKLNFNGNVEEDVVEEIRETVDRKSVV